MPREVRPFDEVLQRLTRVPISRAVNSGVRHLIQPKPIIIAQERESFRFSISSKIRARGNGLRVEGGGGAARAGRLRHAAHQLTSPPRDVAFSTAVATSDGAAVTESHFTTGLLFSDVPIVFVSHTPDVAILHGYLAKHRERD